VAASAFSRRTSAFLALATGALLIAQSGYHVTHTYAPLVETCSDLIFCENARSQSKLWKIGPSMLALIGPAKPIATRGNAV
jgi:hypothetical protein